MYYTFWTTCDDCGKRYEEHFRYIDDPIHVCNVCHMKSSIEETWLEEEWMDLHD